MSTPAAIVGLPHVDHQRTAGEPGHDGVVVTAPAVASSLEHPRLRRSAMVWAIWTAIGLALAEQAYLVRLGSGAPVAWWRVAVSSLTTSYFWAAATPAIVWLTRRFPFERQAMLPGITAHLVAAALLNLADAALNIWLAPLTSAPAMSLWMAFLRLLVFNLACYIGIAGIAAAIDFARLYRERAVAAAELSAQLTRAQLHALQSQLRPHFLFNTLNAIAEQAHVNPATADRMVTQLSGLLRASLLHADRHEVPLRAELHTLSQYLEIMEVRHHGRFTMAIEAEGALLDALVPAMVLQPIVENAIHHGVEPCERKTHVAVRADRTGSRLRLTVADDGCGLPQGKIREGIGLGNTRERLRQLYGGSATLSVRPRPGVGVVTEILLPYHIEGVAGA